MSTWRPEVPTTRRCPAADIVYALPGSGTAATNAWPAYKCQYYVMITEAPSHCIVPHEECMTHDAGSACDLVAWRVYIWAAISAQRRLVAARKGQAAAAGMMRTHSTIAYIKGASPPPRRGSHSLREASQPADTSSRRSGSHARQRTGPPWLPTGCAPWLEKSCLAAPIHIVSLAVAGKRSQL